MARTYRRQGCRYDYVFALWDIDLDLFSSQIPAVRKRLARFHSDSFQSQREPPPKRFRNVIDRSLRSKNLVALARWAKYRDFDLFFYDFRCCRAWLPM